MEKAKAVRYKSERQRRRARLAKKDRRIEVRKGIGACLFTLGIPLAIAGVIVLIVSNAKSEENAVPSIFPTLGPILLTLSIVLFAIGSIMTDMVSVKPCFVCCLPNDPKSFCWKRCPALMTLLMPHEVSLIIQREAGLNALQTEPSKSTLKKPVDDTKSATLKRGVRFFDSEHGNVRISTSSDQSEGGRDAVSNTSLLSLRHCKIYPKEGETLTSSKLSDISSVYTLTGNLGESVFIEPEVFSDRSDREHTTYISGDVVRNSQSSTVDQDVIVTLVGCDLV